MRWDTPLVHNAELLEHLVQSRHSTSNSDSRSILIVGHGTENLNSLTLDPRDNIVITLSISLPKPKYEERHWLLCIIEREAHTPNLELFPRIPPKRPDVGGQKLLHEIMMAHESNHVLKSLLADYAPLAHFRGHVGLRIQCAHLQGNRI